MSLFGQLYFKKVLALELLNLAFKKYKILIQKAYLLFDLLGMNEYKQIIRKTKYIYNKQYYEN